MRKYLTVTLGALLLGCWAGRAPAQQRDPVAALALLLKDKSTEVRRASAFALKYIPQAEAAVPALVEAFKDEDEVVRDNAVDAITLMPPKSVLPSLILALRDTKEPLMRLNAARALGRLRSYTEEAIPDLILLLKDENSDVRQTAVESLRRIQGTRREY